LRELALVVIVAGGIEMVFLHHSVPTALMLVGFVASITLHEVGHFVMARAVKIRATKFFIGFGPTVWSFHRGDVEYGVKLLPLGGFIAISGMDSNEIVDPEYEARTFRQATYPRRVLVLLAGPAMNAIICVVALFALYGIVGVQTASSKGTGALIAAVLKVNGHQSPAEKAGLVAGDRILRAGSVNVTDPSSFVAAIQASPDKPLRLLVSDHGHTRAITVLPTPVSKKGHAIGVIGVEVTADSQTTTSKTSSSPFVASIDHTARATSDEFGAIFKAFGPSGWHTYSSEIAGSAKPTASSARLVSPVGLVRIASQASAAGVAASLMVLAVINIALGVVNMLPLPPLDGGQIAVTTYERIRSRPGRRHMVNPTWVAAISTMVIGAFLIFSLASLYLDISKPVPNPFG
jgi:membrane-associated protease RseP (regulator of RpoE activity)